MVEAYLDGASGATEGLLHELVGLGQQDDLVVDVGSFVQLLLPLLVVRLLLGCDRAPDYVALPQDFRLFQFGMVYSGGLVRLRGMLLSAVGVAGHL